MNFEEFCNSNKDTNNLSKDDKFEKYNQNLQKNIKNNENYIKNDENLQKNNNLNKNFDNQSQSNFDEELIKEKMQKYQNMNQQELLTELLKESKKQKQNGNLDNKKLDEIRNSMSALLDDEQKKRLEELIKMLR